MHAHNILIYIYISISNYLSIYLSIYLSVCLSIYYIYLFGGICTRNCKASNSLIEVMFADDRNLFLSHKNIDTLFASMNKELENVSTWFKSNKLSLNIDKTSWLLFHLLSKRQSLPQTLPNLLIENIRIKREYLTKFLGVFIDENLSWKNTLIL